MHFSDKEMLYIRDKDFLQVKIEIINKIHLLFENVRSSLFNKIKESGFKFAKEIDIEYGKIFRGENYKLLPYVVLDYPKLFSNSDTFAFRTMFWWGNLFSFTLHLQGKSLDKYKSIIIKNSRILVDGKTYICVNDTPWEYHYSDDNYRIFTENDVMLINDLSFLKISCKYELEQYDRIPQLGVSFLEQCLELLKDEK